MTSAHHTPLAFGGPLNAAAMEFPLSELDAAIQAVITTGSGASTSLTAQALAGQKDMAVADRAGWLVGDVFWIGVAGGTFESGVIASGTGAGAGTLVAVANLANTYASGSPVSKSPIELVAARGGMGTLGARLLAMEFGKNVKTFGAVGDGVTNDSPAIQAAIAAVNAQGGGYVYFPPGGVYKCAAQLTIPGNFIGLVGAGWSCELRWNSGGPLIVNSDTGVTRFGFLMGDLYINNQNTGSSGGVRLENFSYTLLDRVFFQSVGPTGIGLEFVGTGSTYANTARSCRINLPTSGSTGVKWTAGAANPNANNLIDGHFTGGAGTTLIDIGGADTALVMGCTAEGGATYNLRIRTTASSCRIIGNRFESGPVTIEGNDNRLIGNTYATTAVFTDTGARNMRFGEPDKGPPSCGLTRTAVQSIPNNAVTAVAFDAEDEDAIDVMHDTVTNNSRATIKQPGRYRITGSGMFAANATGIRQMRINKGGVSQKQALEFGVASDSRYLSVSRTLRLIAGDYIELAVYQNSGGALNLLGSGETGVTLDVEYIGT